MFVKMSKRERMRIIEEWGGFVLVLWERLKMLGEARGVFDEERLIYTGIVEIGRQRERGARSDWGKCKWVKMNIIKY